MRFCETMSPQKGLPLQPDSEQEKNAKSTCPSLLRKKFSALLEPESQDGFRGFQKTTKTQVQKVSQLVTNLAQQSGFIELISSSDIWGS